LSGGPTGKKLTEKASEIVSGTNEKVVETVGSVTESVTGTTSFFSLLRVGRELWR
jgi:hypothetical protein